MAGTAGFEPAGLCKPGRFRDGYDKPLRHVPSGLDFTG